ncbi:MAG: glutathione S-transferase family protein [Pseudomonadota bacterium]
MLTLHCAPNTIAVAAIVALNEGVHWQPVHVDFASAEQTKPEYLAINPKGRVPTLITPEGPLTETGAILEYIGDTAVPKLVPTDPLQRGRMRELMYYLASTMHVNHAHKKRGARWATEQSSFDDMQAKVPETMTASCAYIEPQIVGPYLFGAEPTLADCYLYAIATWLEGDGVDTSQFPNLTAWRATMEARASVQKAVTDGFIG